MLRRLIPTALSLLISTSAAFAQGGIPIGALPAATALSGSELTIVQQNAVTKQTTVSAFGPALLTIANNRILGNVSGATAAAIGLTASQVDTMLGLGTAAFVNTGASGHALPFLDIANTWSALQTLTAGFTITGPISLIASPTGTLENFNLGAATPGTGKFTTLEATGTATFDAAVAMSPASGLVSIGPTTTGSINNMTIGATTAAAGTFTTLKTTGTTLTFQSGGVTGTLTWAPSTTGKTITLPNGTTDFTATGATNAFLKQNSAGAAITVATIACADLSNAGTACTAATGTSGATLPFLNGTNTWSGAQTFNSTDLKIGGAGAGVLTLTYANSASSNTVTLPAGTTDFSATGGTSQVIKQTSSGGALTVARLACADLSDSGTQCTSSSAGWPPTPTAVSTGTTATANTLYCADTTSAAFTLTLPASPSNGDKVGYIDCKGTFGTNNLTIGRNGNKVMNLSENMTVNLNNQGGTLIYYTANTSWQFLQ